eukprot:scpid105760/ scgid35409/ 
MNGMHTACTCILSCESIFALPAAVWIAWTGHVNTEGMYHCVFPTSKNECWKCERMYSATAILFTSRKPHEWQWSGLQSKMSGRRGLFNIADMTINQCTPLRHLRPPELKRQCPNNGCP